VCLACFQFRAILNQPHNLPSSTMGRGKAAVEANELASVSVSTICSSYRHMNRDTAAPAASQASDVHANLPIPLLSFQCGNWKGCVRAVHEL
jgi:hypothetical protein